MEISQNFFLQAVQLMVFMVFITAVIEVIKGISAKGVWGIAKELFFGLYRNTKLSEGTLKALNFVIALIYLRVFNYGVMVNLLGLHLNGNAWAWWLDYIATASLCYMGADWVFQKIAAVKAKAKESTTTTSESSTATSEKSSTVTGPA